MRKRSVARSNCSSSQRCVAKQSIMRVLRRRDSPAISIETCHPGEGRDPFVGRSVGKWIPASRDGGRVGKEFAGNETAIAAVIERHLDDGRRGGDEPTRGMDGECGGVVVGVAAFIGMREHGRRLFRAQQIGEAPRQTGKVPPGLLVGDAETEPAQPRGVAGAQRRRQLRLSRRSVIRDAGKAVIARIVPVARRAVGDMHEQRVVEAAELRAEADRLVVGMRDNDHDAVRHGPARGETREDCLARVHTPAATASGAWAEPARQ